MRKIFNVAGPCNPEEHYMLSTHDRCRDIFRLIGQRLFFAIYAQRQSGKTTLLLDLMRQINRHGKFYGLYVSLESVQKINKMEKGIPAIIRTLARNIQLNPMLRKVPFAKDADLKDFNNVIISSLSDYYTRLDKPLVILFDEVDCLADETLISFLRQLRDGYINRSIYPFIHSAGLVGMKNIKNYSETLREANRPLGTSNPFNVISETHILKNFTLKDTQKLYRQHTQNTGQKFSNEVINTIYFHTQGQPWLVNHVAKEVVVRILQSDFSKEIKPAHINYVVKKIMQRPNTHIGRMFHLLKARREKRQIYQSISTSI